MNIEVTSEEPEGATKMVYISPGEVFSGKVEEVYSTYLKVTGAHAVTGKAVCQFVVDLVNDRVILCHTTTPVTECTMLSHTLTVGKEK